MLLSKRFTSKVLQNQEFQRRVLSVVVDEAHVVSHWGASFRKKYGSLGVVRSILQKGTPIVAVSATLPERVRKDVLDKLQFDLQNYLSIDIGNDRPNVSIVVRAIENPLNTYSDLDFVLDGITDDPASVKKSFVYADNIAVGTEIIDHLDGLVPEALKPLGIIRPYSAAFDQDYRNELMRLFREGVVRVLVCTDAAGMASARMYTATIWSADVMIIGMQHTRHRGRRAVETTWLSVDICTACRPCRSRKEHNGPRRAASAEVCVYRGLGRGLEGAFGRAGEGEGEGEICEAQVKQGKGSKEETITCRIPRCEARIQGRYARRCACQKPACSRY